SPASAPRPAPASPPNPAGEPAALPAPPEARLPPASAARADSLSPLLGGWEDRAPWYGCACATGQAAASANGSSAASVCSYCASSPAISSRSLGVRSIPSRNASRRATVSAIRPPHYQPPDGPMLAVGERTGLHS